MGKACEKSEHCDGVAQLSWDFWLLNFQPFPSSLPVFLLCFATPVPRSCFTSHIMMGMIKNIFFMIYQKVSKFGGTLSELSKRGLLESFGLPTGLPTAASRPFRSAQAQVPSGRYPKGPGPPGVGNQAANTSGLTWYIG